MASKSRKLWERDVRGPLHDQVYQFPLSQLKIFHVLHSDFRTWREILYHGPLIIQIRKTTGPYKKNWNLQDCTIHLIATTFLHSPFSLARNTSNTGKGIGFPISAFASSKAEEVKGIISLLFPFLCLLIVLSFACTEGAVLTSQENISRKPFVSFCFWWLEIVPCLHQDLGKHSWWATIGY